MTNHHDLLEANGGKITLSKCTISLREMDNQLALSFSMSDFPTLNLFLITFYKETRTSAEKLTFNC